MAGGNSTKKNSDRKQKYDDDYSENNFVKDGYDVFCFYTKSLQIFHRKIISYSLRAQIITKSNPF